MSSVHCSLKMLELDLNSNIFVLYCPPYHLRLSFPQPLLSFDYLDKDKTDVKPNNTPGVPTIPSERVGYNAESNILSVYLIKLNPSEYFEHLSDHAFLLLSHDQQRKNVVDNELINSDVKLDPIQYNLNTKSWSNSTIKVENKYIDEESAPSYGFNMDYKQVFIDCLDSCYPAGIAKLNLDPDSVLAPDRSALRIESENKVFNTDSIVWSANEIITAYSCNSLNDYESAIYEEFIAIYNHIPWFSILQTFSEKSLLKSPMLIEVLENSSNSVEPKLFIDNKHKNSISVQLTINECQCIQEIQLNKAIPTQHHLDNRKEWQYTEAVDSLLVELLIGYIYNEYVSSYNSTSIKQKYNIEHISTHDDYHQFGSESHWNITILSPSLMFLDTQSTLYDTIVAVIRRLIILSQIRSIEFAFKLFDGILILLSAGSYWILKCIIHIHCVLDSSSYHVLRRIFIEPLILKLSSNIDNILLRNHFKDLRHRIECILSHSKPFHIKRPMLWPPSNTAGNTLTNFNFSLDEVNPIGLFTLGLNMNELE